MLGTSGCPRRAWWRASSCWAWLVKTADGMPIYHEAFDGNTAEAPTILPTVRKVLARCPHIRRLVMVADRGLLSVDNLDELAAIALPSGQPLEFILAVPGRH
jgi:transposase